MNIETTSPRRAVIAARDAWSPRRPAETSVDLRALAGAVSYRRWLVAGCTGLFALVAAFVAVQLPDRYTATVQVMLNARETRIVDIDNVVAALPTDARMIEGEISVILANETLHDVIMSLGLYENPDFNPVLAGSGAFGLGALIGALFGDADPQPAADVSGLTPDQIKTIKAVRQMIEVEQVGLSLVIAMRVSAPSPSDAASIANALARRYIDGQLALKAETTANATDWLRSRAVGLRDRVETSEQAVESFRAAMTLGDGWTPEMLEQQRTELVGQFVIARAARAQADAALAEAVSSRAAGQVPALPPGPAADAVGLQRAQLETLLRERSALATRFGPQNPQLRSLDLQIGDMRAQLDKATDEAIGSLAAAASAAQAREAALDADINVIEMQRAGLGASTLALRQLERQAEADREIYATFLLRLNELSEQSALQQADARIISSAVPSDLPIGPNRKLIVAAAGVFGLLLGSALAIVLGAATTTFRTDLDIRDRLGLRTVARLPRLRRRVTPMDALQQARRQPFADLSEAMRDVMVALSKDAGEAGDGAARSVAVASAMPREGRTTLCVLLADFMRRIGKRAVIVDCDMHGAALGRAFGTSDGPDLVSVVAGESDLDAAIRHDPVTGLDYLPSLDLKGYGPEVLYTQAFEALLRTLQARYDIVILDTPPLVVGPDACALCRHVDLVLFAVRWNKTSEQQVESAVAKLFLAGARRLGVALTMVDRRREALYRKRVYSLDAV